MPLRCYRLVLVSSLPTDGPTAAITATECGCVNNGTESTNEK